MGSAKGSAKPEKGESTRAPTAARHRELARHNLGADGEVALACRSSSSVIVSLLAQTPAANMHSLYRTTLSLCQPSGKSLVLATSAKTVPLVPGLSKQLYSNQQEDSKHEHALEVIAVDAKAMTRTFAGCLSCSVRACGRRSDPGRPKERTSCLHIVQLGLDGALGISV